MIIFFKNLYDNMPKNFCLGKKICVLKLLQYPENLFGFVEASFNDIPAYI